MQVCEVCVRETIPGREVRCKLERVRRKRRKRRRWYLFGGQREEER